MPISVSGLAPTFLPKPGDYLCDPATKSVGKVVVTEDGLRLRDVCGVYLQLSTPGLQYVSSGEVAGFVRFFAITELFHQAEIFTDKAFALTVIAVIRGESPDEGKGLLGCPGDCTNPELHTVIQNAFWLAAYGRFATDDESANAARIAACWVAVFGIDVPLTWPSRPAAN